MKPINFMNIDKGIHWVNMFTKFTFFWVLGSKISIYGSINVTFGMAEKIF